ENRGGGVLGSIRADFRTRDAPRWTDLGSYTSIYDRGHRHGGSGGRFGWVFAHQRQCVATNGLDCEWYLASHSAAAGIWHRGDRSDRCPDYPVRQSISSAQGNSNRRTPSCVITVEAKGARGVDQNAGRRGGG